jgi:hypothetical protein
VNVIKIIAEHLTANGYGGLAAEDAECGCELADLAPCGNVGHLCEPGYKHFDPRKGEAGDWCISKSKECPPVEVFDRLY